jgi:hypothetical protein
VIVATVTVLMRERLNASAETTKTVFGLSVMV